MPKPYPVEQPLPKPPQANPPGAYRYEIILAGSAMETARKETVTILAHVPQSESNSPLGLHLAALLRVRDLLSEQIAALGGP
jgi:hypothetical protein